MIRWEGVHFKNGCRNFSFVIVILWIQQYQKWQVGQTCLYEPNISQIYFPYARTFLPYFAPGSSGSLYHIKPLSSPISHHFLFIHSKLKSFFNLNLFHESRSCPLLHKWTSVDSWPYKIVSHSSFQNNVHKGNISRPNIIIVYFR